MKKNIVIIMIFVSSVCFAQSMNVTGHIPRPNSDTLYRIQVGAYKETANAERVFNRLRSGGLNPAYENHNGIRRVVLAGISANNIPHVLYIVYNIGFSEVWIREEKTSSGFNIITTGNGAVSAINDFNDNVPPAIVQTIPSFRASESTGGANTYPSNAPVILFFNDKIYLDSIEKNIDITADGNPVDGTIVINEGANGYAVLTFTPNDPLPVGGNIAVTVKKEIQDDGGNRMQREINLSYIAEPGSETNFNNDNFGFESGGNGIFFAGDGAVRTVRGDLVPFDGSHYAAISTGEGIASDSGRAIGSSSSQILLGPIQQPFTVMSFYYDFISAEFNDYVGSKFDDNAMVTVLGPKGSYTEIISSVNSVRYNNTRFRDYPGMPSAGHTGWQYYEIGNINVGSPAYIIFTVTDVGDTRYTSILAVDSIELE